MSDIKLTVKMALDQASVGVLKKDVTSSAEVVAKAGNSAFSALNAAALVSNLGTASAELQGLSKGLIELDTASASMRTLGAEAAAMAPKLEEVSIKMSKDLPFAASQFQGAFTDAIASGVQGGTKELGIFAETAAKLAVGGGAELADVTKGLGATLNAFGASAQDAGKYADILFNTVNYGVTTIPELNSQLSGVTATSNAAGIEFENIGASLALMTQKGVPTAQSVTKLNSLLVEIQKPGAGLKKVLDEAGVSLESIKNDELPVTLEKISKGLKATGQTATQAFSSSEAGAAFNLLVDGSKAFAETLDSVKNETGTAQNAYMEMSKSIDVQNKQLTTRLQTFILEGIKPIGPAFGALTGALGTATPLLQTGLALKGLIPEGAGTKIADMAKSIVTRLVPGLFVQTAATAGATTAQTALNTAMLANPAFLVVGGIVALAGATAVLSRALNETAEEKKADAVAQGEVLAQQKQDVDSKLAQITSTNSQIESYKNLNKTREELKAKTKLTADEEERLKNVTGQLQEKSIALAKTYPGAIKDSANYTANIANLSKEAENSSKKIVDLNAQSLALSKQIEQNSLLQLNLEVAVKKEALEDSLADVFDDNFFESYKGAFTNAFSSVTQLFKGDFSGAVSSAFESVKDIANSALFGFGGELSELVFGTSDARKQGEAYVKQFSDGLSKAKDSSDVNAQVLAFNQKIIQDTSISDQDKQKLIKGFAEVAKAKVVALDGEAKALKNIKDAEVKAIVDTYSQVSKAGGDADKAIGTLAKTMGISAQKAKELAINDELKKATASGGDTAKAVETISQKYKVSKEQVQALVDNQKQLTAAANETKNSVDEIAKAYAAAQTASKGTEDTLIAQITALRSLKAQGKLNAEQAKQLEDLEKQASENKKVRSRELTIQNKAQEQFTAKAQEQGKKLKDFTKEKADEEIAQERELAALKLKNIDDLTTAALQQVQQEREQKRQDILRKIKDLEAEKGVNEESRKAYIATLKKRLDEGGIIETEYQQKVFKIQADSFLALQKKEEEKTERENQNRIKSQQSLVNALSTNLTTVEAVMENLLKSGTAIQQAELEKQAEQRIQSMEKVAKEQKVLFGLEQQATIENIVSNSEEVKNAIEKANAVLLQNKPESEAYKNAQKLVEETKNRVRETNEEILSLRKDFADKEQLATIQREFEYANIRAGIIKDEALKERDTSLASAKQTLDLRLFLAKGNLGEEAVAKEEFEAEKLRIEQRYLLRSNSLKSAALDFAINLQNKLKALQFNDNSENEKALEKEEDDLRKSLAKREISYREFVEKLNEIDKKRTEFSGNLNQLIKVGADTIAESSQSLLDGYLKKFNKATEEVKEGNTKSLEAQGDAANAVYTAIGGYAVASAAQQIAAGKSVAKASLDALLTGLIASVPIFITEKFGKNDPITAGVLTAGLIGLLATAKAAVASAKFASGGFAGVGGRQLITVGEQGPEAIIPAHVTRAYRPQILKLIQGQDPSKIFGKDEKMIKEYHVYTDPKMLDKFDKLSQQVEQLTEATRHNAVAIKRNTTFEGKIKIGLNPKEAVADLEKMMARKATLG